MKILTPYPYLLIMLWVLCYSNRQQAELSSINLVPNVLISAPCKYWEALHIDTDRTVALRKEAEVKQKFNCGFLLWYKNWLLPVQFLHFFYLHRLLFAGIASLQWNDASYTRNHNPGGRHSYIRRTSVLTTATNAHLIRGIHHIRVGMIGRKKNRVSGSQYLLAFLLSFWQTGWFRLPALAGISTLVYAMKRWRMRLKHRRELELTEIKEQVAALQQQKTELEMQKLRAQMNSHFLFNSLNAINRFILQNNCVQASAYLSKFSKLVRLILQNSQEAFIPLFSELEALELYLELEALRFDDHFTFAIVTSEDLDMDLIKIPPLLIQPYAENAIWHGLMHKDTKGHLDIQIFQEDETLFFKITDDGVGRNKAAEIKNTSYSINKPMGMRITADRISLMQHNTQLSYGIQITDKKLPDGTAAGTEVLIQIPLLYYT